MVKYFHQILKHLSPNSLLIAEKLFVLLRRCKPIQIKALRGLAQIARIKPDKSAELTLLEELLKASPREKSAEIRRAELLSGMGRNDEAEKRFLEVRQRYPEEINAVRGLVKIARIKSDRRTELALLEELLKVNPLELKTEIRKGTVLSELGRCEEAEKLFTKLLEKHPEEIDVLKGFARTAEMARDYNLANARWTELIQRFPENSYFQISHIKSLLKIVEIEKAQNHLDRLPESIDPPARSIVQSEIHVARLEWDAALKVIDEACLTWPDNPNLHIREIRLRMIIFRRFGDSAILDQAQSILKDVKRKFPQNSGVGILVSEFLILKGHFEDAAAEIDQLPNTYHQKVMELKAWRCHILGDENGAKRIWGEIQSTHYIPHIEPPSPQALRRVDAHSLSIGEDEIILFTVVRNEKWRLPWFLNYYRSLGVDRFFFVDNDSSDGTKEYLLEQKDNVHVFWTPDSYGNACSGMQWVNELVRLHGNGNWCMYVDVDEAFVFPGVEQSDLRSLTAYMDSKGHEALFAFMNDMFAEQNSTPPEGEMEVEDFLATYPLFDNHYHFSNVIYCPYQYVSGGVRKQFGIGEMLTKTPLIRSGLGINFLLSSHRITPAVISDVTGVLLHFKLAGDFQRKFLEDAKSNTRIPDCQRRHMAYAKGLKQLGDNLEFTNNCTMRYTSSAQLTELGLIQSPPDFSP